jgi:hypothetical protein
MVVKIKVSKNRVGGSKALDNTAADGCLSLFLGARHNAARLECCSRYVTDYATIYPASPDGPRRRLKHTALRPIMRAAIQYCLSPEL